MRSKDWPELKNTKTITKRKYYFQINAIFFVEGKHCCYVRNRIGETMKPNSLKQLARNYEKIFWEIFSFKDVGSQFSVQETMKSDQCIKILQ